MSSTKREIAGLTVTKIPLAEDGSPVVILRVPADHNVDADGNHHLLLDLDDVTRLIHFMADY